MMGVIKRHIYLLLLAAGILLISTNALAVEYSPGCQITSEAAGIGYNELAAVLELPGNSDIKGIAETGAVYNYLGLKLPDGKSFEIGLTKDKFDLTENRWSVFAYANYEGAFSYYGTEGRWVNFRRDGAAFSGPILTVPDGSTVNISLKVLKKDEAVFEMSGHEPIYIKIPGADPQEGKQEFRRVTSLVTDDPQGFFKNTRWSGQKIKKGQEPYAEWNPKPGQMWLSNNMDKNDPAASWVYLSEDHENKQSINIIKEQTAEDNSPYAFELWTQSDKKMRVHFAGNRMYHQDREIGFGVGGMPLLALRYMAEEFGFAAAYEPETGTCAVSKGQYSFRIAPGSKLAGIYWAGEKVNEKELTVKPMIRNNVLYLYSLDISDLLGLIPSWDNEKRIWDVLYRDYAIREFAFPAAVKGELLTIKGLLRDDGRFALPQLEIRDKLDRIGPNSAYTLLKEYAADFRPKYEMSSSVRLQDEIYPLQVRLTNGQRIIYFKSIEVLRNIKDKELVVEPPFSLASPTAGYIEVSQPVILISGSVGALNSYSNPAI